MSNPTIKETAIVQVAANGKTYTCSGEQMMYQGQLVYVFRTRYGLDVDLLLCADRDPDEHSEFIHVVNTPGGTIHVPTYEPGPQPTVDRYLTFTANEDDSSVAFVYSFDDSTGTGQPPVYNLQYRLDDGEWLDYEVVDVKLDPDPMVIELSSGKSVQFKGINPDGFYHYEENPENPEKHLEYYMFCEMQGSVSASGDITSILNGTGGDVALPESCYSDMFSGCSSLTTAPNLPSTTLAAGCYGGIFAGCTSLTTAPELPATTLAYSCYESMFLSCTSLTASPELPATTLADNCYDGMFSGCTSLTSEPELPATTLAESCYSGMFNGCTSLITAPELPATTLAEGCYSNMFYGCSLLESVTCLATDISAEGCTDKWLYNVSKEGTFTKAASMDSWETGTSGIPSGWEIVDADGSEDE